MECRLLTGEEAYSIAMTVADTLEFADAWNIHILATDISARPLDHAEHGVYDPRELETVTPRQREQYFFPRRRTFCGQAAHTQYGDLCSHEPGAGGLYGKV